MKISMYSIRHILAVVLKTGFIKLLFFLFLKVHFVRIPILNGMQQSLRKITIVAEIQSELFTFQWRNFGVVIE